MANLDAWYLLCLGLLVTLFIGRDGMEDGEGMRKMRDGEGEKGGEGWGGLGTS